MNYKPYTPGTEVSSKWNEALETWKKSVDDKETAFRSFIKHLTESHYYAYMNLPANGDDEYDRGFLTLSPQDSDVTFIAMYTTIKEVQNSIPKPTEVDEGRKIELVEVNYAYLVRELALADEDKIDGIVINPFSDDYIITLEDMSNIARRACTGLNHTEELGNYTPANIFIKEVWKHTEGIDEDQRAENFKSVLESIQNDALFALPIVVDKEDIVVENGEPLISNRNAELGIRMLQGKAHGDEANIVALFTSQEDIELLDGWNAEDDEHTTLLLTSDLNSHIEGLNNGYGFDAIAINPFTDNIVLTKDFLKDLGLIHEEEMINE